MGVYKTKHMKVHRLASTGSRTVELFNDIAYVGNNHIHRQILAKKLRIFILYFVSRYKSTLASLLV